ncbi:MAG: hypothetical protein COZ09_10190 [Comamonadaceae bacterium CG_4_10_14_3_um_filter_60_42]|nr:MAG: hypothetical protein COZ09_10190 [Comamonadaceae bacterium CG_4_10_14_3_um_filter_60_42]
MALRYSWFEIRYLIVAPVTLALLVYFMGLFRAKPAVDRYKVLWIIAAPFVVVFLVMDALYQLIIGTWLFLERPRDILFTGRLKRLDEAGDCRVDRFKRTLNEIDPGHV